jgi:hypothetical protein
MEQLQLKGTIVVIHLPKLHCFLGSSSAVDFDSMFEFTTASEKHFLLKL